MKGKKAELNWSINITTALILIVLGVVFTMIFWKRLVTELIPMIIGIAIILVSLFIIATKEDFFDSPSTISIVAFFFIIGLVLALFPLYKNTFMTFVGMNIEYELPTEDYNIYFKAYDKYWQKVGCKPTGCANKNACGVEATVIDEVLGCPIEQCYGTGYYDCKSSYVDRCQYGAVCEYPDSCTFINGAWSGTCCDRNGECVWRTGVDIGTNGGVEWEHYDNCAWAVRIEDKNGTVIQAFNAHELYGEDWSKDEYYREPINFDNGELSVKYISDSYGVVQRRSDGSGIFSCEAVIFQVEDDRYRYDVCIGNDGLETVKCADLGYNDVLTKHCKLQCPNNVDYELDYDNCECVAVEPECTSNADCPAGYQCLYESCQEIQPECTVNSQCQDGYECVNNYCVPEEIDPDPEPQPEPLNWWQKLWKTITDFFKNIFKNMTWW